MAFIVESGDGDSNSTSYADLTFADLYADSFFSDANLTIWEALSDEQKERYLNRGTKYIDMTYAFYGTKLLATQALQFPRDELYDTLENEVSGVPDVIKEAVCLAAKRLMNSTELAPDLDRGGAIKREKVDTIDITYADGASGYTKFTEIDNILKASGFIQSNRNSRVNARLIVG